MEVTLNKCRHKDETVCLYYCHSSRIVVHKVSDVVQSSIFLFDGEFFTTVALGMKMSLRLLMMNENLVCV